MPLLQTPYFRPCSISGAGIEVVSGFLALMSTTVQGPQSCILKCRDEVAADFTEGKTPPGIGGKSS